MTIKDIKRHGGCYITTENEAEKAECVRLLGLYGALPYIYDSDSDLPTIRINVEEGFLTYTDTFIMANPELDKVTAAEFIKSNTK